MYICMYICLSFLLFLPSLTHVSVNQTPIRCIGVFKFWDDDTQGVNHDYKVLLSYIQIVGHDRAYHHDPCSTI